MVDKEGQSSHRHHQELHPERVMVAVVGGLKFDVDEIYSGVGGKDVDDLHECIIGRDEIGEEI